MVPGKEEQRRETERQAKPGQTAGASLPLREVNTVCIVFHNIDPVTRPHAVQIVKKFIKNDLPPETYIGVFNLNETLIPVHEFTKNREELLQSAFTGKALDFSRASAALLTPSPTIVTVNAEVNNATHTASVSVDTTGGEVSKTVIMGADVDTGLGANRLRGTCSLGPTPRVLQSHLTGGRCRPGVRCGAGWAATPRFRPVPA